MKQFSTMTDDGGTVEVCRLGRDVWLRWTLAPPETRNPVDSLGCTTDRRDRDLREMALAILAALGPERKPITRKRRTKPATARPPHASKPKTQKRRTQGRP